MLSTLHTNDAPSTINRLMNMGIEPFLVSTSVNLICAQRLVRRICKECKEPIQMPTQALVDVGFTAEEAPKVQAVQGPRLPELQQHRLPRPCRAVRGHGDVPRRSASLILSGASAMELRRKAIEEGMITLRGCRDCTRSARQARRSRKSSARRCCRQDQNPGNGAAAPAGAGEKRPTGIRMGVTMHQLAEDPGRSGRDRSARHDQLAAADPHRRQDGAAADPADGPAETKSADLQRI